MKKILYAICLGLSAISLGSCKQDDIEVWNVNGFAWFSYEKIDYSFKKRGIDVGGKAIVPLEITVATEVKDYDRNIAIEVIRKAEKSETKVVVPENAVLKAGESVAHLNVEVTYTTNLDVEHDTITFQIMPNDQFEPGLSKNLTTSLCLYNGMMQPSWWTNGEPWSYAYSYLGYFTELKMEVWWDVVGNDDPLSDEQWYGDYGTYLIRDLQNYVYNNNIVYPEGTFFDGWDYSGCYPYFGYGSY